MPQRLLPLPVALLNHLGCVHAPGVLEEALAELGLHVSNLRQLRGGDAYPVSPGKGLDLMLQCINPQAPERERRWGLHAVTLHSARSAPAGYWRAPWPKGIHPDTATAGNVVSLLAEDEDDAVLMIDSMCCFEILGFDARRWIVQGLFDPQSKSLLTLSLIRSGAWAHGHPEEVDTQPRPQTPEDDSLRARQGSHPTDHQ